MGLTPTPSVPGAGAGYRGVPQWACPVAILVEPGSAAALSEGIVHAWMGFPVGGLQEGVIEYIQRSDWQHVIDPNEIAYQRVLGWETAGPAWA